MNSRMPYRSILVCFLHFTEGLKLTINHPHRIIAPPTTRHGDGLPILPNDHPLGVASPMIPPDGGKLLAPPQQGDSKEGRIGGPVRKAWEKFKTIIGL